MEEVRQAIVAHTPGTYQAIMAGCSCPVDQRIRDHFKPWQLSAWCKLHGDEVLQQLITSARLEVARITGALGGDKL